MEKQMKKKKRGRVGQVVSLIAYMLVGACAGFTIARNLPQVKNGLGFLPYMAQLLLSMVLIYLAIFLHMALHEAGHMVFGLLTGYRFSSFRVGSFVWVKTAAGIKCKRFSLAGTGGQCLLEPPAWTENGIPYRLYNLGGVMVNLMLAVVFLLLWRVSGASLWSDFCITMVVAGVAFAIINGIPMSVGPVDNDGRNALMMGKNMAALHAFWVQLHVAALQVQGVRMKDMPEELFQMPTDDALDNSMIAATATFCCSRLIDQLRLDEAQAALHHLLSADTALEGLQRQSMLAESLYCALLLNTDDEEAQSLYTKELQQFFKAMRTNPSVLRIEHAWQLLHEHNEQTAQEKLKLFDKYAPRYPYPQEIESERALIQLTLDKWAAMQH